MCRYFRIFRENWFYVQYLKGLFFGSNSMNAYEKYLVDFFLVQQPCFEGDIPLKYQ